GACPVPSPLCSAPPQSWLVWTAIVPKSASACLTDAARQWYIIHIAAVRHCESARPLIPGHGRRRDDERSTRHAPVVCQRESLPWGTGWPGRLIEHGGRQETRLELTSLWQPRSLVECPHLPSRPSCKQRSHQP